ncbi:phosphoribosylformylglycinamidine synthase [Candidatus Micrarchaeota archaeon]|nr:phosphoribosylformylglycinamidine synthase [Candidatus Micrarchaeota archaeon]
MAHRIEVRCRKDQLVEGRTARFKSRGHDVQNIRLVEVYTVSRVFSRKELEEIASKLANPVFQEFKVDSPTQEKFDFAIEVGFLPGVTDNAGSTAKQIIEDALKIKFSEKESVHSSQLFFFDGDAGQAQAIAKELANPLIQRVQVKTFKEYREKGMEVVVPSVRLDELLEAEEVALEVGDDELKELGKKGILDAKTNQRRGPLALDLASLHAIRDYFRKQGRNPTDLELEALAQTWSEHCKHTIFAAALDDDVPDGLYKTYIKSATNEIRRKKGANDICVSVFTDNSGGIIFDENHVVTHKVETHNSPSALDPFGGAITGIVGVNRDTIGFGLGAKPAINYYGYCFADPETEPKLYRQKNRKDPVLLPRQIMDGVVRGVNVGGNCSGIPTPQGWCYFEPRYTGKPLVFVGTVGIMPREKNGKKLYEKRAKPGDKIVMIGGRVGKDGIHGATFSSEALDSGSPATAVQIGDPITQKKLSDAIVKEARDLALYDSITDNGAGGLSCSVAEMAKECGGWFVQLEKVPLKYSGMAPWEIWVSESQERMTLAVPPPTLGAFMKLMKEREVEATVIGEFTDSGKCAVEYNGRKVMDVHLDFLHDGLPKKHLKTTFTKQKHSEPTMACPNDLNTALKDMLKRKNICSKEFISTQYDHAVQGGQVVGPLQGKGRVQTHASLTKVVLESQKAVGLSQGIYPSYSDIDTYHMAAAGIDTAVRGLVALGVPLDKIALLDNFCWCSSEGPERLGQLKRTAKACYDCATTYGTPFISGKDSMFNDFKGFDENNKAVKVSVPPTLLISSIGVMDDSRKAVTMDAKFEGDLVYVVGETKEELGGSEYFALLGFIGNAVPKVDAEKNKGVYEKITKAIEQGFLASSYAVNYGGLGVALAKTAIAGGLGMELALPEGTRSDYFLFSESQGRFVVTIDPKNKQKFEKIMGGEAKQIGLVKGKNFVVKGVLTVPVEQLEKSYKSVFANYG